MADKPDLTALLGSRICHDLISPIGAIGNGVELVLMQGGEPSPEMDLISQSVAHANARIRFFRLAFGSAQGEGLVALREIRSVLSGMTHGSRLKMDWGGEADCPRATVKLIFLLILCLESALPMGGVVSVTKVDGGWSVTAVSTRLKIDPELWAILTGEDKPGLQPNEVQFALVWSELLRQSRRLTTEIGETEVRFSF